MNHVYDQYRKVCFNGIDTQSPAEIAHFPNEHVFVTTGNAAKAAKELFTSMGKSDDYYAITEPII